MGSRAEILFGAVKALLDVFEKKNRDIIFWRIIQKWTLFDVSFEQIKLES